MSANHVSFTVIIYKASFSTNMQHSPVGSLDVVAMQLSFGPLLPGEMEERSPESQRLQITSIFNPWYLVRIVQHICHSGDETFFGCSLTGTPGDNWNDANFILTVFEDVFNMGNIKKALQRCFQSTSTLQSNCSHHVSSSEKHIPVL